eukprot:COSAG05_NODE_61_length_23137_cov_22.080693_8_plen_142_part_00
MHVRSTAVSEIRTLDMHARARFQRSNSVMHVFTVMHDQLCMMRALFNTSFTRILLALLLATSQTIGTVAIEIVRRSKLRVSGLRWVPIGRSVGCGRAAARPGGRAGRRARRHRRSKAQAPAQWSSSSADVLTRWLGICCAP